jgi:hypothetical protein
MLLRNLILAALICIAAFACQSGKEKGDANKGDTITLNTSTYTLRHLKGWELDTADEDFDIERYFFLDSPSENGFISFFVYNTPMDLEELVQNQIDAHLAKSMKGGQVSRFTRWGKYEGKGARIKGKLTGIWKGEIAVFSAGTDSSTFLTVMQVLDRDRDAEIKGLKCIEKNFTLK